MRLSSPRALTACVLAMGCLMAGCGESRTPALEIAAARERVAQKDYPAAVIHLKTALQQSPQDAEARFLLGDALLNGGDAGGAIVELRKALDLGYAPAAAVPVLAAALADAGQFQKLVDEFGRFAAPAGLAGAEFKAALATAHLQLGDVAKASTLIDQATAEAPGSRRALLVRAQLQASAGRIDESLATLDSLLGGHPDDTAAWYFKGQLLESAKADRSGAVKAYREVLRLKPRHVAAHSSLILALLAAQDNDGARQQVQVMREALPSHPATQYQIASLAFADGKIAEARTAIQQVLKVAPDNTRALQLAAAIELQAGGILQAETALIKALQIEPSLPIARRLLAQAYLRSGRAEKALETLKPMLEGRAGSAAAHAVAGEAQLVMGDVAKAERHFIRAQEMDPDDTLSRTALAMMNLGRGRQDLALSQLEALAKRDSGTHADFALIAVTSRLGLHNATLAAIDRLQAKTPGQPVVALLRGRAELLRKNRPAAIAAFEQALKEDPAYLPAARALADLDLASGDPASARRRFESVVARDPRNVQALTAIAGLAQRAGAKKQEVVELLNRAVGADPREPASRADLVRYLLQQGDAQAALAAAQTANAALPDVAELVEVLAMAQEASGEPNQALSSFGKLTRLQPASARPHLRIAALHARQGSLDLALQSLDRAVQVDPGDPAAHAQLFDTAMQADRLDVARNTARAMQARFPSQPLGWASEGVVEMKARRWPQAVASFRVAFDKAARTDVMLQLYRALVNDGQTAAASRLRDDWAKAHPRDAMFHNFFGDMALARRSYAEAEAHYRIVAIEQPRNAAALNNLAWTLTKAERPGAVDTAQQAVALAPQSAQIRDTLAIALEADGRIADAEAARRAAVELAPDDAALRLELAKLLSRTGKKDAARAELGRLGPKSDPAVQREASELLRAL